jgi:putative ABC transport system ATP-binding protein
MEIQNLVKTYRQGEATIVPLGGVDLTMEQGDFLALMGHSGTGKSTLLNLVAGIDRSDSGTITIAGMEITRLSRTWMAAWRARHIGYIFQTYNLVPVLTAYENIELPLLLLPMSRSERRKRVGVALEAVGLVDRAGHLPRQLSGGQAQRIGIARAIVADPTLVVADEPTGNLDDNTSEQIVALLGQLNRQLGTTILMVTHERSVAAVASRRLRLEKGKLTEMEPSAALAPRGDEM